MLTMINADAGLCPGCGGVLYVRTSRKLIRAKKQVQWLRCHECPARFKALVPRRSLRRRAKKSAVRKARRAA